MENEMLWKAFSQSGKIDDYLRYRQAVNAVAPTPPKEGVSRDPENRRADHSGK